MNQATRDLIKRIELHLQASSTVDLIGRQITMLMGTLAAGETIRERTDFFVAVREYTMDGGQLQEILLSLVPSDTKPTSRKDFVGGVNPRLYPKTRATDLRFGRLHFDVSTEEGFHRICVLLYPHSAYARGAIEIVHASHVYLDHIPGDAIDSALELP